MLGKGSKIYCKFSGNLMNKVMTEKWVEIQEKQNLQLILCYLSLSYWGSTVDHSIFTLLLAFFYFLYQGIFG